MEFITHTGEVVSGARLEKALNVVADWYVENAKAIRLEDAYADHITEEMKDSYMHKQLELAEEIRQWDKPMGFWLWQRVNQELTGECVALLPK